MHSREPNFAQTHAHCIEDTSGFFVVTPEDEGDDYPEKFVAGCNAAGIPRSEIPVAEALRREPLLNPRISRVFEVPTVALTVFWQRMRPSTPPVSPAPKS